MGRPSKSKKEKEREKKLIKHINVHIPKDKMYIIKDNMNENGVSCISHWLREAALNYTRDVKK